MNINDWENRYYSEPDSKKRKEMIEEREALEGPSGELEFIKKLFDRRYIPEKKEPASIDHMLRGVLYLKHSGTLSGLRRMPPKKELQAIFHDLSLDLFEEYPSYERAYYQEVKHASKTYFHLCVTDRGYTSFIWGLGQLKDSTLKNKLTRDAESIAHEIPERLGLTEKLRVFSQAFYDGFTESV